MQKPLSKFKMTHRLLAMVVLLLVFCIRAVTATGTDANRVFQDLTVTGKVTSGDDGQPFPGVNIVVKGTTIGTVTDNDGKFSLSVPSSESILVFSAIGYSTAEISVGTQTSFDVPLAADVTSLTEVVVVGYGTVKKSDVTGALSSVSAEQLRAVPVQSIAQALQGRAAGVDIATTSHRPGDNPTIRIRGNRSLIGGNDPLIVLDGIPLPEGSSINDFNPGDVASIEILKDASSTAIYGSRGANGVIIVTTKKGKAGKAKITYDGFYGVSSPLVDIDMKTGGQHAELRREAYRNNNGLTYFQPWADVNSDFSLFSAQDVEMWNSVADGYEWEDRDARIPKMRPVTAEERAEFELYYDQYLLRYPVGSASRNNNDVTQNLADLRAMLDDPNLQIPVYNGKNVRSTNWGDLALQTGRKQSHQFSVSGGTDKIGLFFGGGYYGEEGLQKGQGFKRYNMKVGLDYQASDILKVGGTINGNVSEQEYGSPLYFRAIGQIPIAIPYDANGNVIFQPGGDALIFSPLNEIDDFVDDRTTTRIFGSYYADLKLAKGLRYHFNGGTDFKEYRRGRYQGAFTSDRRGGTSWAEYNQEQRFTWVMENLLFYDKQIGDHTFGLTGLYSIQKDRFESSIANVANLPYESLYYNLGSTNAAGPDAFGSDFTEKTLISYMARINYAYRDKYLLTLTGRRDGLSMLAPGNKWGFFPSASVAWKIHQESFMRDVSFIDELKLRLGYGEVGNATVPPYLAPGRLRKVPYVWGDTPAWGIVPHYVPNSELKWEGTQSLNLGLDVGLVKGRISGSVEVYRQNTDDLMMWRQLPAASGFGAILENVGKVRNTGIEFSINTINVDALNGFKWTSTIIFSKNKEELVELYGGTNDDLGNRWFIGHPITTYYDWQPDGVWQSNEVEEAKVYGRIPGQI